MQQTNTGGKEMSAFARVCQPQGGQGGRRTWNEGYSCVKIRQLYVPVRLSHGCK